MPKECVLGLLVREFGAQHHLSNREQEVVLLLLQGNALKEAAATLQISSKTADQYWSRIYSKVGCKGREAVLSKVMQLVAAKLNVFSTSSDTVGFP